MSGHSSVTSHERTARDILEEGRQERIAFSNWLTRDNNDNSSSIPSETNDTSSSNISTFTPNPFTFPTSLYPYIEEFEKYASPSKLHYRNCSGFINGHWSARLDNIKSNNSQTTSLSISESNSSPTSIENQSSASNQENSTHIEGSSILDKRGSFAWDSKMERSVTLNIREVLPSPNDTQIAFTKGSMSLEVQDFALELQVDAVHYLPGGTFFMTAISPSQHLDLRRLIDIVPEPLQNRSGQVILKELDSRINSFEESIREGRVTINEDSDNEYISKCNFKGIGQLSPLPSWFASNWLDEYERELSEPTGATMQIPPPLTLSLALYSENCAMDLVVKDARGIKYEVFWQKSSNYAAALSAILILQTVLLIKQMEHTLTRASLVKVSHATIIIQSGMDGYTLGIHVALGTMIENHASLSLLLPAFAACLCGCFFGSRYGGTIKAAEIPSTPSPAPTPTPRPSPSQAAGDAAERRRQNIESTPIVTPIEIVTEERNDVPSSFIPSVLHSLNLKYVAAIALISIPITVIATVGWVPLILAVLYSYWLPQIYHNVQRGYGRRALLTKYLIGTSLCRLFLPLYAWQCPGNLLFIKPSSKSYLCHKNCPASYSLMPFTWEEWIWLLVLYQLFQAVLLILQDKFGPRFFLPASLFPDDEQWDWHPILPPGDVESGESGKVDCVICFESIDISGSNDGSNTKGSNEMSIEKELGKGLNRFEYAVPPCYHIAHTSCLETWLQIKTECPVCRRAMPPM